VAVCARVNNYTQGFSERGAVKPDGRAEAFAACPAGLRPAGGGYHDDAVNQLATSSVTHFGQSISVRSQDPQTRQFYAVIVCTD
jgi:hypothetical protein